MALSIYCRTSKEKDSNLKEYSNKIIIVLIGRLFPHALKVRKNK